LLWTSLFKGLLTVSINDASKDIMGEKGRLKGTNTSQSALARIALYRFHGKILPTATSYTGRLGRTAQSCKGPTNNFGRNEITTIISIVALIPNVKGRLDPSNK
jgi:hypothetical protein